jgi:hypothetical protein
LSDKRGKHSELNMETSKIIFASISGAASFEISSILL